MISISMVRFVEELVVLPDWVRTSVWTKQDHLLGAYRDERVPNTGVRIDVFTGGS